MQKRQETSLSGMLRGPVPARINLSFLLKTVKNSRKLQGNHPLTNSETGQRGLGTPPPGRLNVSKLSKLSKP